MLSLLTALVVDDEEKAVILLKKLLSDTNQFSEIRSATSCITASHEMKSFDPDLIFLDINMPGMNGIQFLKNLLQQKVRSEIIFVTAFDQYALEAIRNHAFGYLLKPVSRKELADCIVHFREHRRSDEEASRIQKLIAELKGQHRLRISTRSGYYFIDPNDILFCEADGNYTRIELGDRNYLCTLQLGVLKTLLPAQSFVRTGRSLIINYNKIRNVDKKAHLINFEKGALVLPLKVSRSQLKDLETGMAHESIPQ